MRSGLGRSLCPPPGGGRERGGEGREALLPSSSHMTAGEESGMDGESPEGTTVDTSAGTAGKERPPESLATLLDLEGPSPGTS